MKYCASFLTLLCGAMAIGAAELPYLRKQGAATQLVVDGKPYVMLAGELHNSSASSLEYMESVWPKLVKLNLNTVIATVNWELLEPEELRFVYALVDGLIRKARQHRLKLVLIWFASWKNGVSSYAPLWVKTDLARFPRAQSKDGRKLDVLSPFSIAARDADARAFRALMRHIREVDAKENTIIMVQVQNEVGIKRNSRDFSPLAEAEYSKQVPAELIAALKHRGSGLLDETRGLWASTGFRESGSWREVFGDSPWADEAFMAWHYARYIGHIAGEGKKEYPIPMFVNAWLQRPDGKPGDYPSGGPVARVMEFWKAGAPEIDIIAPDIYLPDFKGICASYTRAGNPLLIPEAGRGSDAAAKAFYAFARHEAIGFAPFGIDSVPADHPLAAAYRMLTALLPEITANHGTGRMTAVLEDSQETDSLTLGEYRLNFNYKIQGKRGPGFALIMQTAPDTFFLAGSNVNITLASVDERRPNARLGPVDEMVLRNGTWLPLRRLNGDETAGGVQIKLPPNDLQAQKVMVYRY